MFNWFLILLLVIVAILIYLYWTNKITGKTLTIIILVFIILMLLIPSLLGFTVMGLIGNMCMNPTCDQIKLPVNMDNMGPLNANWNMYKVNGISGRPVGSGQAPSNMYL